ncbi:MAG: hypothetical protein ACKVKV_07050, partial [Dehalococcoidia bacterium]
AYNLEAVIAAIGSTDDASDEITMISPESEGSIAEAVAKAKDLRANGQRSAIEFQSSNDPIEDQVT